MSGSSDLTAAVGVALLAFSCSAATILILVVCFRKSMQAKHPPAGFISVEGTKMRDFFPLAWRKERSWQQSNSLDVAIQARPFQLLEIKIATDNFSVKLGEGGFGSVYRGRLPDGSEVAVKAQSYSSNQGVQEFFNEVQFLSRAHHRNVVALVGYCQDAKARMLVYEFLSGGTLEHHLHDTTSANFISWKLRLTIALDAAKGIEYLHYGCNPPIIHRDLKSGNILLTSKMQAKVADFGLSRLGPETESSRIFTTVKGTSGYVDPEYYETQELTHKSDVYSFGIVLLEMISGREALMDRHLPGKQLKLSDWARGFLLERRINKIIDPVLAAAYNIESVWKVAELAMFCVEPRAIHRPTMTDVVQELKQALEIENGNVVIPIVSPSPSTPLIRHTSTRSEPLFYYHPKQLSDCLSFNR